MNGITTYIDSAQPFLGWGMIFLEEVPKRWPRLVNLRPVGADLLQAVPNHAYRGIGEEVPANDFGLKMPRYVATFEAAAEMDLDAVQTELTRHEGEVAGRRKWMVGYRGINP